MKLLTSLAVVLALTFAVSGEQQRILRRVIKSTPTATNLGRIRAVTVRSAQPEAGAVTEISGKEAANFGQRGANATATAQAPASPATKTRASSSTTTSTTTTTTSTPTTTSTTAAPITSAPATTSTVAAPVEATKRRASERQQTQPASPEVELLSGAPSSWQTMTAVEAPASMLIATGTRPAAVQSDLSASGSALHSSEESSAVSTGDFLRSSSSKTSSSFSQSAGETFSRVRQQPKQSQQQSFFYPQPAPQQPRPAGKTSNYKQATKTHWYQPSTTTARPAPIIQQQEQQQYEQQNEQYVEQQQQVEYGAAPLGQAEPFAFDFKTEDNSGNGQYRKEESDKNGVVRGSYGYTDASGIYRHVDYVADQNGFRANIKSNEPGLIGETQPASIQLAGGPSAQPSSRLQAAQGDTGEWNGNLGDNQGPSNTESALAPPDFESSHKSDRLRVPRHYRN